MERLPLLGGSYSARSPIAACTRCINLFPERNPKESPVPLTHYQRPGLRPLAIPANPGPGRNIWTASDGTGYAVIGNTVYYVTSAWQLVAVGQVTAGITTPCSLVDNGIQVMVADGTANGWFFTLGGAAGWTDITDPSWTGATRLDYIDTFIIWNIPKTNQFQSSLSNQIQPLDPTYIAAKTNWPDPIQTLIVNRHEMLLIGRVKTERWYDAGNALFPFAELPGAYTEHGCVAPYSVASADISVYWLGQDQQGIGIVYRQRGYDCERISNHALEVAIRKMYVAGTITDAIGYTYQQDGHVFYVLQFPSGNQTWVWDEAVGDPETGWHQECWTDPTGPNGGNLNRHRGNGYASLYGKQVTIDWENGTIYQLDLDHYYDSVNGMDGPITWLRTFPHLMSGIDPATGAPTLANGHLVEHNQFQLDIECGNNPDQDNVGVVKLRWSDDRGKTWGQDVMQSAGALGQYTTRPNWPGLGQAMDRVYEVEYSIPGATALNGAWVKGKVLDQ